MDDEVPDQCVDPELWQACAGSLVRMPAINSLVYYFPQGHAEHAQCPLDNLQMINPLPPSQVLCCVESLMLMADPETEEVYVKIRLVPIKQKPGFDHSTEEDIVGNDDSPDEVPESPMSFAKILTKSDAKIGNNFAVPKECALTIFPSLNYEKDPPDENISCIDVHGERWSFRHIYKGLPKPHWLTEGWREFVKRKKLVAGDSIVFLKKESGEIHVGIRRMKGGFKGSNYYSSMLVNDNNVLSRISSMRLIGKESVMEAMILASSGQAFEIVYYPRGGTPEYCMKAALVKKATRIQWFPGMKFYTAVMSEDVSKIIGFSGIIAGIKGKEQNQWPKSLWRQLELKWEVAGGMSDDVMRVNPWLVEPAVSIRSIPPKPKKLCMRSPPSSDYISSISPLFSPAHQSQVLLQQQQLNLTTATPATDTCKPTFNFRDNDVGKDDMACALTLGVSHAATAAASTSNKSGDAKKKSTSSTTDKTFMLFGQTLVTDEEQIFDVSTSGNGNDGGHDDALPQD